VGWTSGRAGRLHISVELHKRAGRGAALKGGLTGGTKGRADELHNRAAGGLHNRAGQRDALKSGLAGCTKGLAGGL